MCPRPVDTLIAELARIADELERHGMHNDMVPVWGALAALQFGDGATSALDAVLARLKDPHGLPRIRGAPTPSRRRDEGSGQPKTWRGRSDTWGLAGGVRTT